jgi:pimeloyl-ACP methyl ester carboxylesterase
MFHHILFKGKPVHFRSSGQGPALVLLHGFLESLSIWGDFEAELNQEFNVICIDLPGHGSSGVQAEVQSMSLMADAVKAVLDKLKVKECVMVGHSMGGYVALAFANQYPRALQGFCLFNSTALEDPPQKKKDRVRALKVIQMNPAIFVNEAIPNLFAPGNIDRFRADVERIKKEALRTPILGINGSLLGMKDRPDQLDFIAQYPKPILFIAGEQDPVMPLANLKNQLNASPRIESLLLPNVGHMGFIEAKEETLSRVREFTVKCVGLGK